MVRLLIMVLLLLAILAFQQRLWFSSNGLIHLWQLEEAIAAQQATNAELAQRNKALEAEVIDLKTGLGAIEERSRSELGMVQEGEQFIYIIEPAPEVPPESVP